MYKTKVKKIAISVLLAAFAAVSFFYLADMAANPEFAPNKALQDNLNTRLQTSAAIFAVTKVTSGSLSLLQSVQLEANIFMAGVSVAPLKILSSISNTLDYLSNIFLMATGALILQKILINITSWIALKAIIPVVMLILISSMWTVKFSVKFKIIAAKYLIISLLVISVIPASVAVSSITEKYFFSGFISKSKIDMEDGSKSISTLREDFNQDKSTWDKLKENLSVQKIQEKISNTVTSAMEYGKNAVYSLLNIIVAYLFTSILIPLLTLWIMWVIFKNTSKIANSCIVTFYTSQMLKFLNNSDSMPKQAQQLKEKIIQDKLIQDKLNNHPGE